MVFHTVVGSATTRSANNFILSVATVLRAPGGAGREHVELWLPHSPPKAVGLTPSLVPSTLGALPVDHNIATCMKASST